MARPRPTTPVLSELASVPGDALAEGTPPPIGPHTAAQRHDGVLTLLDDSADTASISTSRRSLEKAEAKRLQKLEKFRKQAEKDARKAAKKQGRPGDWESFMLEVPEELLSPEELTKRRWLQSVPMFDGLDGAFVGALAQALQTRTVAAGSILIEKGSVGDEMYFIKEGRCDVHLDLADDAVATREPGEFFGETALLEDAPRNAYVRATAAMVLYVLSKAQLTEVLARFPEAEPIIRSPADDHRAELVQKYQEEAARKSRLSRRAAARLRRSRRNAAAPTLDYSVDVERRHRTLKQLHALLEVEISESLVTLGVLLMVLIHEARRTFKGEVHKFGETLKYRCKHARDQHVIPLHEGWMMKQGELGESFKRRYFVLLPDVWTCARIAAALT